MGCSPRIQQIVGKGKRGAAEYIKTCRSPEILNEILDRILSHEITINDSESIDWIRWLMAGGNTPENFTAMVKEYHDASTCGLIWTAQSIAYRCRTCSLSPCMSLCADCFVNGNHDGHDYNMFRSQTGGACDCGDSLVMQSSGFCRKHGTSDDVKNALPPPDLLYIAELMAPRIFCRLILHLRNSHCSSLMNSTELHTAVNADDFLAMLCELSDMGAAMMRVLTSALTNTQVYRKLTKDWSRSNSTSACASYMTASERFYQEALKSLTIPEPPSEFKGCLGLQTDLHHKTFLEELVFWAVKYEYPQKLIDFLLIMLPDGKYKEALTEAFVLHYSRIAKVLEQAADPDALSKRVAKVNVQMFSIKELAFKMTENLSLLQVMLISLKNMMCSILVCSESTTLSAHSEPQTFRVDCTSSIISQSRFWLLVADLARVLLNEPVAMKFLNDESLVTMWLSFLSYFQGMNKHHRELTQHIEVEQHANSVFLAEYQNTEPLWSLLVHLKDQTRSSVTKKVLHCYSIILKAWLHSVRNDEVNDQVSFHIPLHRSMAIFLSHAVNVQRIPLDEVLSRDDMTYKLLKHPLQIQATFYEIINGLWIRNGLEIKEEAMMYTQNYFCSSMVDADLYLLQILATRLPNNEFIRAAIKQFRARDWFTFEVEKETNTADSGHDSMLEGFLQFLATLCVNRINLGNTPSETIRAELVALLCVADRTHSQLVELIPERYVAGKSPEFDAVLEDVADYIPPNFQYDGSMQQGLYTPKPHIWEEFYDPVHVFLRTGVNKKDFQSTSDRFVDYLRRSKRLPSTAVPWPPFRMPTSSELYTDPRHVLNDHVFHAIVWMILYKYSHQNRVSENVLSLVVYLLEMAASVAEKEATETVEESVNHIDVVEQDFGKWFTSDDLSRNVRTVVRKMTCTESRSFEVNESILSLLVKCYSKLRGAEISLKLENVSTIVLQDRIGEGFTFIEKVLQRIVLLGKACREEVKINCDKLRVKAAASSSRCEIEKNKRDHHDKKRKAEERQRELMEMLAMQREKFAKDHESMLGDEEMDWRSCDSPESVETVNCKKYYCGICHKTLPSTRENPMMLLAYVQATNVLGHRKALSIDDGKELTFAEYMRGRVSTLSEGFSDWTDSVTMEWDHGTYVQSCGHVFDHKCLIPIIMKDVFSCPVCRQYANNAIAILPHECMAIETQPQEVYNIRSDIIKYLEQERGPSNDSELFENVTNTSLQRMKSFSHSNLQQSNVNGNSGELFGLASIARCNIEMDIILRGGSLVRKNQQNSYLVSKKSCILPLLRFLGSCARKLDHIPVLNAWRQLIGSLTYQKCDGDNQRERMPILLRDPVHLLIQLLLTTHASSQKTCFQWIVKMLYNLVTLKAAVQLSYHLSEEQMKSIRYLDVDVSSNLETWCSVRVMKYTINMLERVLPVMENSTYCSEKRLDVETKIRDFSLPFLRIASVLQHYLFDEQLPEVQTDCEEFGSLIKYLKRESRCSELHELDSTKSTVWQKELLNLVEIWFDELRVLTTHNQSVIRSLVVSSCALWSQPKLLQLPYQYKDILETYLKKACSTCQQQCEKISLCLVCGALICLQEKCCERDGLYEAVRHANTCGAGTSIYLTVASSNVVVIHGAKACIWGSVYLDAYGEEDSNLKRGTPLYLSAERYRLLEYEWLYHNFIRPDDFWTLHNNQL